MHPEKQKHTFEPKIIAFVRLLSSHAVGAGQPAKGDRPAVLVAGIGQHPNTADGSAPRPGQAPPRRCPIPEAWPATGWPTPGRCSR